VVSAREVRRDGEVVGYALDFHREDPIIAELGLQSGDVVTQVNGIPLNSPVQGLKVVDVLTTAPVVTATIERSGRTIRLSRSLQ
jgi:general secretion pathway protein C